MEFQRATSLNRRNLTLPKPLVKLNVDSAGAILRDSTGILLLVPHNRIFREANRAADTAAKFSKLKLCSGVWVNRPPISLVSVLPNDVSLAYINFCCLPVVMASGLSLECVQVAGVQ